jgi:hypothetical protein
MTPLLPETWFTLAFQHGIDARPAAYGSLKVPEINAPAAIVGKNLFSE